MVCTRSQMKKVLLWHKIFEYMSAGVPIIASNFPLWKKLVEENDCGLCVDPNEPKQISEAIDYIHQNPEHADRMGKNGLECVQSQFNWEKEQEKLIALYKSITNE